MCQAQGCRWDYNPGLALCAQPLGGQHSAGTAGLGESCCGAGLGGAYPVAGEERSPGEGAWGTVITDKLEFRPRLTWLSGATGKAH